MKAYCRMAFTGRTIITRDFNAAPTNDDRGGQPTQEDVAVRLAMHHLGLCDLTSFMRGQTSHKVLQPGKAHCHVHLCYADPTQVEVDAARNYNLLSKSTGHRFFELCLRVPQMAPAPVFATDEGVPPPMRKEDNTRRWTTYYPTMERVLGRQSTPHLNVPMTQPATVCSLHKHHSSNRDTPTHC